MLVWWPAKKRECKNSSESLNSPRAMTVRVNYILPQARVLRYLCLLGLAHGLASYFGDVDAVPDGMCGKCTFCTTGSGVEFTANATTVASPQQVLAILNACGERDDPRLLARFAFGITSPRLTALKCSTSHPLFGSMGNVDFNILLQVFDAECKKVGYQSVTVTSVPTTSKKRTYTQSSASSSYQYSRSTSSSSSYRGSSNSSYRGRGNGRGRGGGSGRGANHYKRVRY